MNEAELGAVLDHDTAVERVESGDLPEWAQRHFENFRASVTGERDGQPFPCFFGKASVEEGRPLYAFVDSTTHPDALFSLRDALLEYLGAFRDHGDRVSFAVFFKPQSARSTRRAGTSSSGTSSSSSTSRTRSRGPRTSRRTQTTRTGSSASAANPSSRPPARRSTRRARAATARSVWR